MGLFSKLFGGSARHEHPSSYDDYIRLMQQGYKESRDREVFPPDTVWAGRRSKVYHSSDAQWCGAGAFPEDAEPMPEAEAVRRGLHRCKRCEWPVGSAPPEPARRALPLARPVMRR